MMDIETITNPNEAKKTRKENKKHEHVLLHPYNFNMPVAHTTKEGRGWVGRLIKKWKSK